MRLNLYGCDALGWESYPAVPDLRTGIEVAGQLEAVLRMYGFRGVSAPQVGILMDMATVRLESGKILTLVEPEIVRMYGTEIEYVEDCISMPPRKNACKVLRTVLVDVEYGEVVGGEIVRRTRTFSGRDASTVNHEIDHLAGTFFFERASLRERDKVLEEFAAWKRKWRTNGHHPIYEGVKGGNKHGHHAGGKSRTRSQ